MQNDDAQQLMDFNGQFEEDGQKLIDFGQQHEDLTQQHEDLTQQRQIDVGNDWQQHSDHKSDQQIEQIRQSDITDEKAEVN